MPPCSSTFVRPAALWRDIRGQDTLQKTPHLTESAVRHPDQQEDEPSNHERPLSPLPPQENKTQVLQLLARGLAHNAFNALHYVSGSIMMASQQLETLLDLIPEDQRDANRVEGQQIYATAYEGLSKAQEGIRAMQRLVFSQNSEKLEPRLVSDLIRRAVLTVGNTSSIKVTIVQDAKVMVFGGQVEDVIINLIKNAQEAGGLACRIDISVQLDSSKTGTTISVADEGPGIDKSHAPDVFDPGFSTKSRGSGVGLAVSRHIINEHGGKLTLEKSEGKGAKFSIWLPLQQLRP